MGEKTFTILNIIFTPFHHDDNDGNDDDNDDGLDDTLQSLLSPSQGFDSCWKPPHQLPQGLELAPE